MSGWKSVPNIQLKVVSYGSNEHIWGVGLDGKIYQHLSNQWKNIPEAPTGGLKWISVGSDGTVWGVNNENKAFKREGEEWIVNDQRLTQISVGSQNQVWGVDKDDFIYRWEPTGFKKIPTGRLRCVSVGNDGTVWGVNKAQSIFRWENNTWKNIRGRLVQISVGSYNQIWGVNQKNNVYMYTGDDGRPWNRVLWRLEHVSIGSDGIVWGVMKNQVWRLVKECFIIMADPKLKEERIEQGDIAKYGFTVTNLSPGVIVKDLKLELVYNKESFTNDGISISPTPPEKIIVSEDLETGKPVEVDFTIKAEQNAKIGTYALEGALATYNLVPSEDPDSLPIREWTSFEIVKD